MLSPSALVALASSLLPSAPLVLDVEVDAQTPRLRLGAHQRQLFAARLGARSIRGGVRLFPVVTGPRPLDRWDRWLLRIERLDANGARDFQINDPNFTGKGSPPLSIDFNAAAPQSGAFVATLVVRAGDRDQAVSAPVVLPAPDAPEGPSAPRLLISLPAGAEVEAVLARVQRSLRRPGVRVRVEGHWDTEDDAQASSEALARRVAGALVAAGVDEERLDVVGLGGRAPRFPTLSKALRRRNRRIDLVRVPPPHPRAPTTPLDAPPPRGLELLVDGRRATVPLTDTATLAFTMDLDPPAQVKATLHDGQGGQCHVRRSVTSRGAASGSPTPFVVGARPRPKPGPADALQLVAGAVQLTEEGPTLNLEVAAADAVEAWLVAVHVARLGRVVAAEAGEGPPPPRVQLALTSSVAHGGAAELFVLTRTGRQVQVHGPWTVPALHAAPLAVLALGNDPVGLVFSELFEAMARAPDLQLEVQVHGGRRAARDTARRRVVAALSANGMNEARLVWSAGREREPLTLSAHLSVVRPLGEL